MRLTLKLGQRILIFVCLTCVAYVIVAVLSTFVQLKFGLTAPALRILTVLQDLILFIAPALGTAMIITRLPATFLCLDRKPGCKTLLAGLAVLTVSIPMMDAIIIWNQRWTLPESMEGLQEVLRMVEEQAAAVTETMLGGHDIPSLIMGILLFGILAGLSEELYFRGTMQRLLTTGRLNSHLAIWITAFIFSAVHMQVFGFVPRMLLGALFGYALVWSRSLWVPVLMHTFNNTVYVVARYVTYDTNYDPVTATVSAYRTSQTWLIALSAVLTVAAIWLMWRSRAGHDNQTPPPAPTQG